MKIEWQKELATGNREIDSHHQDMFHKIDDLVEACKERRATPVIAEMVCFLNQYVISHFAVEEQLLLQRNLPGTREHLKQHEDLRARLAILTDECTRDGINLSVITNTLKLTYIWLKDHIQLMDKEMIPTQGSAAQLTSR